MNDVATGGNAGPFESAGELREANLRLLKELNSRRGRDARGQPEGEALAAMAPQIREFLARGVAAGIYVEDIEERTACQVMVDYWASILSHTGVEVPRERLADFDAQRLPDLKDKRCPFVGLEAFSDDTHGYFFGREKAVADLLARLATTPLIVVQGASGSGKSSLVLGGVLPALQAAGQAPPLRVVAPFTPGNAVLERLAGAVLPAGADTAAAAAALRRDPRHLVTMLGGAQAPAMLLVIDQFEEVFTLSGEADRRALAAALAELSQVRPADRVILTMREEFSRELNELMPLSGPARFSMSAWPMVYEDLKAAVEGPAGLVNLHFQPGIVDHMVKGVLANGDTALPLLQFALSRLWLRRQRNRITWEVYREIGGSPLKALETFADGVYDQVQEFEEKRAEFERVMTELVRVNRLLEPYRQQVLRSELLAAGSAQTAEVLDLLEENQFIRVTPGAAGDAVVEVKHEALLRNWPRYKQWIEAKREGIRKRIALTEAAQRWAQGGRRQGLLSAWQLHEAEGLPDLAGLEQEFVSASRQAVVRESTWRRLRFVAVGALAVGLIGLYVWANDERQQARETALLRTMADARESAISGRLGRALRSAVRAAAGVQKLGSHGEAAALAPDTRATLLSVLRGAGDLTRLFLKQQAVFQAVAFSPKGGRSLMAYAGSGGQTYLAELDGPLQKSLPTCGDVLVTALAFDPQGRWLAAGCADGSVSLWSTADWAAKARVAKVFDRTVWALAFSRDGRFLAAGGYENKVKLLTIGSGADPLAGEAREAVGDLPRDSVWSMAFSPSADTLLVGDGKRRLLACGPLGDGSWTCKDSAAYLSADGDAIRAIAFSPDGQTVAVGRWQGAVELWDADLSIARRESVDVGQSPGPVYSLAFFQSCFRNHLAVGKGTGLLYRRIGPDLRGPSLPDSCSGPPLPMASVGDEVYSVAFDARSGQLGAATRGGYVAVLDPSRSTDRLKTTLPVNTVPTEQVRGAILQDGGEQARIAIAVAPGGPDGHSLEVLTLARRDGRFEERKRTPLLAGEGEIRRLSASAAGRLLATLSRQGAEATPAVSAWQFDEGFANAQKVFSLGAKAFEGLVPKRMVISPDGQWLVLSMGPPWRPPGRPARDTEQWCEQEPHASRLLLVAVGRDPVTRWVDSGLCSGFRDVEITFSADGGFFAAGGDAMRPRPGAGPGHARLWKVGRDGLTKVDQDDMSLSPFANKVHELAFAAENRPGPLPFLFGERTRPLLMSGGEYGEIDTWRLDQGGGPRDMRRVDSRPVWLLAFSPDGSMVAASDSQHVVRLRGMNRQDVEPLRLSASTEPEGNPGFLAFGGAGNWLASAAWSPGQGGTLYLWDLEIRSLNRKACGLLRAPGQNGDESASPLWQAGDDVCKVE